MLVPLLYLVPDGPPVNITITEVTPYSVTLQWDPPTPDKQNGVIVSYVINVMTGDQVQRMVVQSNDSQQKPSVISLHTQLTHSAFQQAPGLDKVHSVQQLLQEHQKQVKSRTFSIIA